MAALSHRSIPLDDTLVTVLAFLGCRMRTILANRRSAMTNLFESRRSVGDFDSARPLDSERLREIVRLAAFAPSAMNLQPWRLIAVRSPEARQRLYDVARHQPRILQAPVTLIVVGEAFGWDETNPVWDELALLQGGDRTRVERSIASATLNYGATSETRARFAAKNAALFSMGLLLAAKSLGVDSHPMDGMDLEGVSREFGLSEREHPILLIALGYHDDAKAIPPRRRRRTYDELVEEV
jgi:nitroreductase